MDEQKMNGQTEDGSVEPRKYRYDLPDNLYSDSDALDELALDVDEATQLYETPKEREAYSGFISDYKAIMAQRLGGRFPIEVQATVEQTIEQPTVMEEPTEPEVADEVEHIIPEPEVADEVISEESVAEAAPERTFEDFEIMVELPFDVEFHSDIVEKSARKNAEDFIKLVPEKSSEPLIEDAYAPTPEPEHEIVPPTPISHYSLHEDFNPEQIAMSFDDESEPVVRDIKVYDEKRPRIVDHVFDLVEILAITLTAAIIITTIFFRFSFVDGHSMDMTLANGDTLLISNLFYTPDYDDIVVFEYVTDRGERRPLVKRIIGLEGDTIRIEKNGDVYRNGEPLSEEYVYLDGKIPISLAGEWDVGEGEIFVMGDHRNDSKDSREFGPISTNAILGRAVLRLFPIQSFGAID